VSSPVSAYVNHCLFYQLFIWLTPKSNLPDGREPQRREDFTADVGANNCSALMTNFSNPANDPFAPFLRTAAPLARPVFDGRAQASA